jgi:sulfoxide reductase heme-binding subunit YedZ
MVLIFDYFTNQLTINPIQAATQLTGKISITLLTIMLALTPLSKITGLRIFSKLRKQIGLYSFMYASIHMLIFIILDYSLIWDRIYRVVIEKLFILLGLGAFTILLLMAITSFKVTKIKLGKYWKRLHRFVYLAAVIIVIHFILAQKGNILTVRGNILEPAIYAIIILILLTFRLPLLFNLFKLRNNVSREPANIKIVDGKIHKAGIPVHVNSNSIVEDIPSK